MKKAPLTQRPPRFRQALATLLALLMLMSTATGLAFTPTPTKTNASQLALVSVKAVDVSSTITGIRYYTDLTDSTRYYQKSEVIYVAVTVEVKNLAKSSYTGLESIDGKSIEVSVGSQSIDLSYAKTSAPTVLSYIYSGDVAGNIGTVATAMLGIGNVVSYDKKTNEVTFTVTGTPLYQTGTLNALNIGASIDEKSRIVLPALKAKDGKTTVQIGATSYTLPYSAPESLQYTVLLTGVVRDTSETKGSFYARMMLENAERFESEGSYYVKADGSISESKPSGTAYVDYIEVEIEKLSLKDAYAVYRYFVPSSALYSVEVPIQYRGDDSSYTGEVLARVNPNVYDSSAQKGELGVNVAGGVRSAKAHKTNNLSDKTTDVPMSSIVYTSNGSFFAPSFYAGLTETPAPGALVEANVALAQGPVRQTRNATLAQQFTASVTYDRPYKGSDDTFDYLKDLVIDLHSTPTVSIGLEAAKSVWEKDTSSDKPEEFDPERYPYIVIKGAGAAGGSENALATYEIRLSSADNGAKTTATVTIGVDSKEETAILAGEHWSPTLLALNAKDTGLGTTSIETNFALTKKTEKTLTWEENGLVSKLLSYNDKQFSVLLRDANGNELTVGKDYKLVKASTNGIVTAIGIVPIANKNGDVPEWVGDDVTAKVTYFDPNAGDGTVSGDGQVEKASDALQKDVVGRNGIAAYIVTTYTDETPIVTLISEDTYFASDIGAGIGSFESGRRIYHASARNFIYADNKGGSVKNANPIGNVFTHFNLDTGFNSTYKLESSVFEAKGASAAYSDSITGSFAMGVVIQEENLDEGTSEDTLDTEDEDEIVEAEEEEEAIGEDEIVDEDDEPEVPEEEPAEEPETEVKEVPQTGDFGTGSGVALFMSACVTAIGFFAIMRRVRQGEGSAE